MLNERCPSGLFTALLPNFLFFLMPFLWLQSFKSPHCQSFPTSCWEFLKFLKFLTFFVSPSVLLPLSALTLIVQFVSYYRRFFLIKSHYFLLGVFQTLLFICICTLNLILTPLIGYSFPLSLIESFLSVIALGPIHGQIDT